MNPRNLIIPTVLISFSLACQGLTLTTPTSTGTVKPTLPSTSSNGSELKHFENQWVAFDYPKELKAYAAGDKSFRWYPELDLGGELLAGLGDPEVYAYKMYFRSIRVMRLAKPTGYDLQTMMSETYDKVAQRNPIYDGAMRASGPVTVSGMAAYQKTYRVFSGEPAYDLRDIWVEHYGVVDIIAIATAWHNPDNFTQFESMADGIMKSIVIK